MSNEHDTTAHRLWPTMVWVLRVTVLLQCLGNWRWLTQYQETPLLHWMLDPADIGGLEWSEPTALLVQRILGWLVLAAGLSVVWRPHWLALAPLVFLQLLIATAMWQTADGFAVQAAWLPARLLRLFPFATQMLRIAAPAALLLVTQGPSPHDRTIAWTMQMLRWAVASVFISHGIEAWQHNPVFLDLILNTAQRLFGTTLSQETAASCLSVIGAMDITTAVVCLGWRCSSVMGWMAFWGGVTALSRVTANGWALGWHDTLIRSSHCGVPLALVLWWYLLSWKVTAEPGDEESHHH